MDQMNKTGFMAEGSAWQGAGVEGGAQGDKSKRGSLGPPVFHLRFV